jgi:hypothetical protein
LLYPVSILLAFTDGIVPWDFRETPLSVLLVKLVYLSGKASCRARFAASTSVFFSESHSKARGTGKTRGISESAVKKTTALCPGSTVF